MSQSAATWLDISLPIAPESVAWAGLPTPELSFVARMDAGAAVNVGELRCSLHTGTHADAPLHVLADGTPVDRLAPELYVGPAWVVRTEETSAITLAELRSLDLERLRPERLLVATPRPYDGVHFPTAVPALASEAAEWLAWLGVRLVGVNVPSIDPLDSVTMDAHRVLFAAGAGVLENLDLAAIPAGPYDLVAAPIRIQGADAAPVRALVRAR